MECHRQQSPWLLHICQKDVTRLLLLPFDQQRLWRTCFYFVFEMWATQAFTWMRWLVCTLGWSIMPGVVISHKLCSGWMWTFMIPLCFFSFDMLSGWKFTAACHFSLLQGFWCATKRVVPWINMPAWKGMSVVGDEIDSLHVFERGGQQRGDRQGQRGQKNKWTKRAKLSKRHPTNLSECLKGVCSMCCSILLDYLHFDVL